MTQRSSREETLRPATLAVRACMQIMRAATICILVSFVLIVISTTVSTGPFVQVLGKVLYYIIVFSAAVSLVTWFVRNRLEGAEEE